MNVIYTVSHKMNDNVFWRRAGVTKIWNKIAFMTITTLMIYLFFSATSNAKMAKASEEETIPCYNRLTQFLALGTVRR